MSMRFLLSSHGASLYGAERVLLAIARGLVERGHDVTLELPHDGPAVRVAQQIGGLEVLISGRGHLPRNARELLRSAADFSGNVRILRNALHNRRFDVVWANSIYNPFGALAGRALGAPVVWHLHERNVRGITGLLIARWIARHCDVALAPSAFVADSFTSAGLPGAQLRVVPNALLDPIQPAPLEPDPDAFVVGYIGQFERRKRAADLLEAVANVDGAQALLIGDGKARKKIEAAVKRLGLEDRTRLTGFQPDIRPFLAECHCIVIPSRNEPFGLVALEAMAAGRPVIAANSGALPEILADAAFYYTVGDIAELAACVRRMRDEPALVASLRAQGLARVKQYSLAALFDRVEGVARDVVALHSGGAEMRA